jgi:hypothetical protein
VEFVDNGSRLLPAEAVAERAGSAMPTGVITMREGSLTSDIVP